jgi:hypothetical protein
MCEDEQHHGDGIPQLIITRALKASKTKRRYRVLIHRHIARVIGRIERNANPIFRLLVERHVLATAA